jgi:phosphohistidine phosphatase SixA
VIVYLIRHASAGKRSKWSRDDRLRPLDKRGRRQAEALVAQLAGRELDRILSSPYLRCVETVEPLAGALGLEVETHDALAEGAGVDAALALLRASGDAVAACVHGDLLAELLGREEPKGSTTVLELDSGPPKLLERLPPA